MSTDSELMQKRQEVRDEILALKGQIPSAWIFNTLGKAFKHNSLGYWLSNIILLNLIVLSPWVVIGLALKEFGIPTTVMVEALMAAVGVTFGVVIVHLTVQAIMDDIAHRIVEKIKYADDLSKMFLWLERSWSRQNVSAVIMPVCLFWTLTGVKNLNFLSHRFVGIGLSVTSLLCGIIVGLVLYVYIWVCLLISNLKGYQYEMNSFSPADSEVISDISEIVMKGIYVLAGLGAVLILVFTSGLFDQLTRNALVIPILVFGWTLIIVQFLLTRSTLAVIANRAKWKTLNRIRDKINTLEATGDLSDKDTAERLFRLADIHKQIMASNTKTFDLKSVTTLFSQLMLPLLGLLLGNIDKVLELLRK